MNELRQQINADDVAWLRANSAPGFAEKLEMLARELKGLAQAIGPELVSLEEMKGEAAA